MCQNSGDIFTKFFLEGTNLQNNIFKVVGNHFFAHVVTKNFKFRIKRIIVQYLKKSIFYCTRQEILKYLETFEMVCTKI